MPDNEDQRSRAIVDDRGRFGSTKQRERFLNVRGAVTALTADEIVFEIGVGRTDLTQRANRFRSERCASKIRVNDNPSPVDDGLQPAGAKLFDRTAHKIDDRFGVGNAGFRANSSKLSPDKIDN